MQNGTYSASEQRLLSEEEELERMMKELQETFPAAEGVILLLELTFCSHVYRY
jgi:hypothetical protein